ncbi:MAG: hypothetical protein NZ730_06505 [Porticoccaceae bacterium]|nr:hypothetical protein [Porticoccaceae bacterium]
MASFDYCINVAVRDKKISQKMADEILESPDQGKVIKDIAESLSRDRREKVVNAIVIARAIDNMESHSKGLGTGLSSMLGKDLTGEAGYANVDYLQKLYTNRYIAEWKEGLEKFRTKTFGLTEDKEGLAMFVNALYGKAATDPAIAKIAKEWLKVTDNMRVHFNEVGGSISKNEDWLLPQHHDMNSVGKVTEDKWIDYIEPLLNRKKMLDDAGKPLDDVQFKDGLKYAYQTIVTGGLNKAQELGAPRGLGSKLSRRGSERRFLYFKNGTSWLKYQKDFGRGDVFTTLTDHIQSKSSDIALLQLMGTNPRNMYDGLRAYAVRESITKGKKLSNKNLAYYDSLFKVVSGEVNAGQLTGLADKFQAWRNIEVASKLGWAVLSSFTDMATSALTASYNKLSAHKVFWRQMKIIKSQMGGGKKGKEYRDVLARTGFVIDTTLGRAQAANRYTDTFGVGVSAKVAEATLRASGLELWTQAMQKGFTMEFAGMLADNFGKAFDSLDFKEVLVRYGITKEDWDAFGKTKIIDFDGAKFADMTKDKSTKFHRMILQEMEYASPTVDARSRAITTWGTKRSTASGQMVRSIMMIKSFPITVMMNHWQRGMAQATGVSKLAYLGKFSAGSTMMGALSLQVKEMLKGRESRDTDAGFWKDAWILGGSGSLFADLIVSDPSKYGQSLTDSIAGVQMGTLDKVMRFTTGNIRQAIKGDETNILGEGVSVIKGLTPDIWQTQMLQDYFFDALRMEVDPKYKSTLRKMARKRKTEYGQGEWWRKGELTPEFMQD